MIKYIHTFDPKKKKKVLCGTYKDYTFTKKVTGKHYMIKEHGYGIQEEAIEQLIQLGCERIKIITKSGFTSTEANPTETTKIQSSSLNG